MRVTTIVVLAFFVVLAVLGVLFRGWVFDRADGYHQWSSGFTEAATPAEAMEKFREAIQMRRYKWAASYCTKDYADLLIKSNDNAVELGGLIDDVKTYMVDKGLQRDKTIIVLHHLDPFPINFKVVGTPKAIGEKKALGFFAWEPIPLANAGSTASIDLTGLEARMFQNALVPPGMTKGIELVKEGDAWKLHVAPTPGMIDAVRVFNDRARTYHTTLGDFRTYMTNGRYDSPQAFETEVLDALRKARPE